MSEEQQFVQVIGFFGGGGSDTPEVYFLPLDKITPTLMDILIKEQGHQWRDVYRNPCRCHRKECFECKDIREAKQKGMWPKELVEERKAWILFNKIRVNVEPNTEIPGKVVKYLLYRK